MIILDIICYVLFMSCIVLFFIKNNKTFDNRMIIRNAIFSYNLEQSFQSLINNTPKDTIDSSFVMESYNRTLFRFYDWGYKHIVPPDVYDKISPIIKEVMDNNKQRNT